MRFTTLIKTLFKLLSELLFPPICAACGTHLFEKEVEICQMCIRRLPRTHFERQPHDNVISAIMWGRCKIELSFALFFYKKEERVQELLHDIKYRGNKRLGEELGRQLAKTILKSEVDAFAAIIPIPLHPNKQRKRGFNQAEVIANGIAEILEIPVNTYNVYRNTHTSSQTKKGRFERWQNVENIFSIRNEEALKNQHILLIDDVITTGSTLEACVNQITTIEGCKVSVATLACAAL